MRKRTVANSFLLIFLDIITGIFVNTRGHGIPKTR